MPATQRRPIITNPKRRTIVLYLKTWLCTVFVYGHPNHATWTHRLRSLMALKASQAPQLWIVLLTVIGGFAEFSGWVLVPICTFALMIAAWPRVGGVSANH